MQGASGARLWLDGDWATKQCSDATEQVEWFRQAERLGTVKGLRLPKSVLETAQRYRVEFVEGHEATREHSLRPLKTLLAQTLTWRDRPQLTGGDWSDYLSRLEDHVRVGDTSEMRTALRLIEAAEPFKPSFCHGDLTLENALIANKDQSLVLIDPNFKPGLFQSYVLDLGKLLQSTHADYHRVFDSHRGVDLSRHDDWLVSELKRLDIWEQALIACLSHLIRLRKYRPAHERCLVDDLITSLT